MDNTCEICDAHKKAYEDLKSVETKFLCACGYDLSGEINYACYGLGDDIVYADNFLLPIEQQTFKKGVSIKCSKCYQEYILELKPIIYNGNHDIHYEKDEYE